MRVEVGSRFSSEICCRISDISLLSIYHSLGLGKGRYHWKNISGAHFSICFRTRNLLSRSKFSLCHISRQQDWIEDISTLHIYFDETLKAEFRKCVQWKGFIYFLLPTTFLAKKGEHVCANNFYLHLFFHLCSYVIQF